MDEHPQDSCFPNGEDTVPVSPKRQRILSIITNKHSGRTDEDILSSQSIDSFTSLQNITVLKEDKTHKVKSDHGYSKYTVAGFNCEDDSIAVRNNQISAGSCVTLLSTEVASKGLHEKKEKQQPLSQAGTYFYSFQPGDEAGCASAKSHTSNDTTTELSTSHGFNQPRKSLKQTITVYSPSVDKVSMAKQNGDRNIPATDHNSSVCEGIKEPDYTSESKALNSSMYSMGSCLGLNHSNDNEKETRNNLLPKGNTDVCWSSGSHAETNPLLNLTRVGKNLNVSKLENDVDNKAYVCTSEEKAQINKEDCMHIDRSATDETVVENVDNGSVTCAVADCPIPSDEAEIKDSDHQETTCGHTVGAVTATIFCELGDDTTQGLPVSSSKSLGQQAEVDCSGIVNETENAIGFDVEIMALENSNSTTDFGSSQTFEDTTLPLHPSQCEDLPLRQAEHVRNGTMDVSFYLDAQNGTKVQVEYESTCQSVIEMCSCTTEIHDPNSQGIHHWEPLLSSTPLSDNSCDSEGSHACCTETTTHLCEECDQVGNFLTSKDYLKTQETLSCQSECAVLNGKKDDNCKSDTDPDLHVDLEKQDLGMIPQIDLLNRGVIETATAVWINDWAKGELSTLDDLPTLHIPVEAPPGSVFLQAAKESSVDPTDMIEKRHYIETNHFVPFTSEPNDAVVPGSDSNSEDDTLLERHEDQSTAHVLFDHVPVGFDTFKKIQLSPLDTSGKVLSTVLSSSPSRAFQMESQLHRADGTGPSGESDNKDISEEMEKCQEKPKKAFLHCGKYRFNEDSVPDSLSPQISTPSASLEKPGQTLGTSQFDLPPTAKLPSITSIFNIEQVSEIHSFPEFEMKKKFDMVMEELGLYFEIRDEPSSHLPDRAKFEPCHPMVPRAEEDSALIIQCSSDQISRRDAVKGETYRGTSLRAENMKTYQEEPEKRYTTVGLECEQEVPLECSHPSAGDESMYSSVKSKDSREQGADDRSNMWSPAFRFLPCLNQLNQRQPEQQQNKRLEPLRTCNRPIRVGLSKRVKTKHLHPYSQ